MKRFYETPAGKPAGSNKRKAKQLSAQFHTMTEYHKSQLNDVIRNHTTFQKDEIL